MMDMIRGLIDGLDPASLLPDIETLFSSIEPLSRLAVLAAPVTLVVLGLIYFFLAPKEANHSLGFRCWWGMGSVEVWQFTQKLAGLIWMVLGVVLGLIALVSGSGYHKLSAQEMMFSALGTIVWQLCLVVVSIIAVNLILIVLFDSKGRRRGQKE